MVEEPEVGVPIEGVTVGVPVVVGKAVAIVVGVPVRATEGVTERVTRRVPVVEGVPC